MAEPATPAEAPAPLIAVTAAGPRGQVLLRGALDAPEIARAVEEVAGLALPEPLRVAHEAGRRVVWMAPDEVLLHLDAGAAPAAVARLDALLEGQHHLALDVSDMRAVFVLEGKRVAEVLAKGVPADLSERGCPVGTARRTQLAGLAVALWRLEAERWEIVCLRSYAHHLTAWLDQAALPGSEVGWG